MTRDPHAPTIVFDLDGTLVDTAPDLMGALNHVLVEEGRAPLPLDMVRQVVGQGAAVMIERGLERTGGPLPADRRQAMFHRFIAHYGDHIAVASRPFDGVREALQRFHDQGHRQAVCTNKPEALSKRLLSALSLDAYFAAVLGGDTLAVRKPDPTHLIETVRRAGGHPAHAVMVGDSHADVRAAKAAQIPVVAVSFGYTDIPARDLGADIVIDHFDALPDAVTELLARA